MCEAPLQFDANATHDFPTLKAIGGSLLLQATQLFVPSSVWNKYNFVGYLHFSDNDCDYVDQDLQVSISFENDSLSWEKFWSFSPNKYLEEVEKCATPGSVAQKKAYFESHYKKIAERKAEIIVEQEKQHVERNTSFRSCDHSGGNTDNSVNGQNTSEEGRLTRVNEISIHEKTMNSEECKSSVNAGDDLYTLKLEKLEEIVRVEGKPELVVQGEDREKRKEANIEEEVKNEMPSRDICEMPIKETKKERDDKLIKKIGSSKVNKKAVANKIARNRENK